MEQKISIYGSITSLFLGVVGKWSMSDLALFFGMLSGAVTVGYTLYKWIKEIIKDIKLKRATK